MIRAKKILDLDKKITDGTVVIASDIHIPFQDKAAVKAFLGYVKEKQPEVIVLNGDVVDFFMLSRFTKGEGRNPMDEIAMCQALLGTLRNTCPNSEIFYVIGNHSMRLEKYVLNKAPELASLIEDVFSIIRVDKFDIRGCASLTVNDSFVIKHGTLLGQKSGQCAIKEMENAYMSGATGHCFSEDVEVLTPSGWKRVLDVQLGELVGTYNKQTKEFEYNRVNDKFVYDNYKELYHIKSACIDIMTTDKHGFIGYGNTGKLKEFTAEELSQMPSVQIPLACKGGNVPIALSNDMIRLLVNISADASIEDNSFRFHLKKERKIKHLIELLDRLGFKYTVRPQSCGTTKIRISVKNSLPILDKYFKTRIKSLPIQLRDVDIEQAKVILNEYSITDGNKNSGAVNAYQISTSKKEEADLLQEIFVKNGMRSSCVQRISGRRKTSYVLTVNLRNITTVHKNNVSVAPYEGKVSCVSVNNGTLVVRSKGKTIITQNCHRLSKYIARKAGRKFIWLETGCLCDLNPEYCINPNWQQGFAVVEFKDGKLYKADCLEIEKGKIL